MSKAYHLRSTCRPEARRAHVGTIFVWTECGREVNAILVDNEHALCHECLAVDARLAELAA